MKNKLLIYIFILISILGCDKGFKRKNTLVVLLDKPVKYLHPFMAKTYEEMLITSLTARGLFYYDYINRKVRPDLIQKYIVSKAGRVWAFHLKPGLKTSGGENINAKFLHHNLTKLLFRSYKKEYFKNIKKVKVTGKLSVKVYLNQGDFNFNALLCGKTGFGIISSYPGRKIKFEGYGPYKISQIAENEIVLKRNPDFKDAKVETDIIVFRVVRDKEKRYKMLLNREADIASFSDLGILNFAKQNKFLRFKEKLISKNYFIISSLAKPLNKPTVRKALLGHSLMRNKFNYSFYNNFSKVDVNVFPEYSIYYTKFNHLAFYNPSEASGLFSKAGVNSFKFNLYVPDNERFVLSINEWVNELKKRNIEAELHISNVNKLHKIIKTEKFGVAIIPLNNWIIHPGQIIYFQKVLNSKKVFPQNTIKIINKALSLKNRKNRKRNLYLVFKKIIENARILGVIKQPDSYVTTSKVRSLKDLVLGRLEKVRIYH